MADFSDAILALEIRLSRLQFDHLGFLPGSYAFQFPAPCVQCFSLLFVVAVAVIDRSYATLDVIQKLGDNKS